MLSRFKTFVSFIAITSCFLFANFLAAHEAGATNTQTSDYAKRQEVYKTQIAQFNALPATSKAPTSAGGIPIKGKTADGKYMVYDLDGELNDLNYSSPGKIWQPADLEKRLNYIAKEDVKAGTYECDFVCKDKKGQIVGLAMWVKELNEKQAIGKKK